MNTIKLFLRKIKLLYRNRRKIFIFLSLYWMFLIYLIIYIATPISYTGKDLIEQEVHIDKAIIMDSYDNRGARMKLEIISNNFTYYVWYPRGVYTCYEENLAKDLVLGAVNCVTVKYSAKQSIRDRITKHVHVVEIQSNDTYYYSINDEISAKKHNRNEAVVIFIILLVIGLSFNYVILSIV